MGHFPSWPPYADREAKEINEIDDTTASNEWDGVFFFLERGTAEQILAECQAKMEHLTLRIKPYPVPLESAKEKYPMLDWAAENPMSPEEWL